MPWLISRSRGLHRPRWGGVPCASETSAVTVTEASLCASLSMAMKYRPGSIVAPEVGTTLAVHTPADSVPVATDGGGVSPGPGGGGLVGGSAVSDSNDRYWMASESIGPSTVTSSRVAVDGTSIKVRLLEACNGITIG